MLDASGKAADGEEIAKLFKYYSQGRNRNQTSFVPFNRISARALYLRHKSRFDKFAEVSVKYGIDRHQYVKFFLNELVKFESDVDEDFVSIRTVRSFVDHFAKIEKRKKVYGWFMKSVSNLAEYCVENEYPTAKEGFMRLVRKKLISPWYVSGKISRYFLCSIPSFRKLAARMDRLTKLDMQDVVSRFDIYSTEVNDAYLYFRNRRVNPFSVVDEEILRIREQMRQTAKTEDSGLFDPSL